MIMMYSVFLIALCALVSKGNAGCNRKFTPTATDIDPDDCTTEAGVPGVSDPDAFPCLVYNDSYTPPASEQLEYPLPK